MLRYVPDERACGDGGIVRAKMKKDFKNAGADKLIEIIADKTRTPHCGS